MSENIKIVCPHCLSTNQLPSERQTDKPKCGRCHKPLFTGGAYNIDGKSLKRHIQSNDIPVIIDFWANWCGPCKMMAPAFEQAARALEPNARLLKLDTERYQEAAAGFNIRAIPTMIAFKNGREAGRQSGALQAGQIVQWARSIR